jgi:ketosteroid isomerase-like protein
MSDALSTRTEKEEVSMRRLLVGAAVAALTVSCSQSTEPQFGQQDAANIRQRTQQYAEAFNGKDVQKLLAFYSSETVFMPPNAPTLRGRDAVGDFYKAMYAEGAGDLELQSKDVGGHGTLAYESGTFSLVRKPASGPETRDRGKYMFIWRFYPPQKAWLMDYTIWSSDLPQRVTIGGGD